jgi:hypothetical protein
MLSDADAACVATALTLWIQEEKKSQLDQGMVQTKTAIHKRNLMTDLMLSEPNDYKISLRLNGP